jgi:all-trans-retinol dehydrogenase (NAD+)
MASIIQLWKLFVWFIRVLWWLFKKLLCKVCKCTSQRKRNFSCDIVLITGGAQGLGKELAMQFSECGATVILWDIDEAKLDQTCSQITAKGRDAFGYVVDCSDKRQVYETAEKIKEEIGNVSILVNNAGMVVTKSISVMTDEEAEKTFKVNTLAHFWVSTSL